MKSKILSIVTLLVVLLLSSCKSDNTYEYVIPANAPCVASVDLMSIANDADIGNSVVTGLLKSGILPVKINSEYIDDPSKMGIDFAEPMYVFMANKDMVCVAMKVNSQSDLDEFVAEMSKQQLCSKPKEKDGRQTGTLLDEVRYYYDSSTMLLAFNLNDGKIVDKQVEALFGQKEEDSFVSTEKFATLKSQSGAVSVYTNMAVSPDDVQSSIKQQLPKGVKISDMSLIANLQFDNGQAVFRALLCGESDAAKQFVDEMDKNTHLIKGTFMNSMPANSSMWGCVGVNGEWLLKQMKEDKRINEYLIALERGIDVEMMLRAVDGDFSIASPFTQQSGMFDMDINAELKDTKFLNDVDYWTESMRDFGMSMTTVAPNTFVLKANDNTIFWSANTANNTLHFSNISANSSLNSNDLLKNYADDIKSCKLFFFVDLRTLVDFSLGQSEFESVVIKSPKIGDIELSLNMRDKKENILKQLLNMIHL